MIEVIENTLEVIGLNVQVSPRASTSVCSAEVTPLSTLVTV